MFQMRLQAHLGLTFHAFRSEISLMQKKNDDL